MNCKNKKTNNCGCGGGALHTSYTCSEKQQCEKEPCSEMFCDECILHCSEDMSFSFNTKKISVHKGDRLLDVLQKLMVLSLTSVSNSDNIPVVKITNKTIDSITLKWNTNCNKVMYKKSDSDTWNSLYSDTNQATLTNLVEKSTYSIYVVDEINNISSITLTVTL